MSGENQRSPFQRFINQFTEKKISDELVISGYALPCSVVTVMGSLVTVKFEINTPNQTTTLTNVTVPVEGSEYVRLPLQVGCKGWVKPADARLGGVTGLGTGTADLTRPANLGALVFAPLGNKGWTAPEDPNQLELYGVDGALIKSSINKEWYARWTTTGVTISNNAGTPSMSWNGAAWEFKGPVIFDQVVTMNAGLQLSGNIESATGGIYSGNITTSGGIEAGVGGADHVTLQSHIHPSNGNPPTPGH